MSQELISLNHDLKELVNDGYEVEIRAGHLVLHRIPYVISERRVQFGELVAPLTINGQEVGPPEDHTIYFRGEYPCDNEGNPIEAIRNSSNRQELAAGLWVDHYFSAKPHDGNYRNFHHKMTHYAQVLGRYARRVDQSVTAQSGKFILTDDPNDPFIYMDTASSRAGITRMNESLAGDRIGIVGMGGTGSYILDYVSKTRVAEIHLFDEDVFKQHNAFRAPGAATQKEIVDKWNKAELHAAKYSEMRKGVVAHAENIEPETMGKIKDLNFVFVSIDDNLTKQWLLPTLQVEGIPFIDVGMGIENVDGKLLGVIRTSIGTPEDGYYSPQMRKIKADDGRKKGREYQRNIQIVELNALNAAIAVIRWKKYRGFYLDFVEEQQSTYTLDGNHFSNSGAVGERRNYETEA